MDEANLLHWKGTIKGPVGTPYENGMFKIDIQLPSDYPFVPPKVRALRHSCCSSRSPVPNCCICCTCKSVDAQEGGLRRSEERA